jgi:hypothetical protein
MSIKRKSTPEKTYIHRDGIHIFILKEDKYDDTWYENMTKKTEIPKG